MREIELRQLTIHRSVAETLVLAVRSIHERNPVPILRNIFGGKWIWEAMASLSAGNIDKAVRRAATHCYVSAASINLFSLEEGTISSYQRAKRFTEAPESSLSKFHERMIRRQAKAFNLSTEELLLFKKAHLLLRELMHQEIIELELCMSDLPKLDLSAILYWDINQHQEKLNTISANTLEEGWIDIPSIENELLNFANKLFAMEYLIEVQKAMPDLTGKS